MPSHFEKNVSLQLEIAGYRRHVITFLSHRVLLLSFHERLVHLTTISRNDRLAEQGSPAFTIATCFLCDLLQLCLRVTCLPFVRQGSGGPEMRVNEVGV